MLIRIRATGQVEDFAPQVSEALLSSGRGELVKPVITGKPKIETAVMPPTSAAVLHTNSEFQRGPRSR